MYQMRLRLYGSRQLPNCWRGGGHQQTDLYVISKNFQFCLIQHWSALIGIKWHWALIKGVLQCHPMRTINSNLLSDFQHLATCEHYMLQAQVYIPKRRTLIQVLPPANAYTKLFATCSCIFMNPFVGHSWIYATWPVCIQHGVCIGCLIAILRQNAYMHEQMTKEFEGRKFLYECTPFGYVNHVQGMVQKPNDHKSLTP